MLQWLRKPSDDPDATEQPSANDPYDLRGQAAVIVSHTSGSTPTFTLATGAWTTAPLTTDTFTVV